VRRKGGEKKRGEEEHLARSTGDISLLSLHPLENMSIPY
jgi:hypothetical protein